MKTSETTMLEECKNTFDKLIDIMSDEDFEADNAIEICKQKSKRADIILNLPPEKDQLQKERFKMPSDKQLIDVAIIFNQGKLESEKLADMVGMCVFVLDRLYENGDVKIKSKIEEE